jgi:4-amino-4-deoxy-L-arabinose transferase-like glycosyltransferase
MLSHNAALVGALVYTIAPGNTYSSRSSMPDVPSLSLSIIGVWLLVEFLGSERPRFFWLSSVCIAFAMLAKIPAALVALPLAYLVWENYGIAALKNRHVWIFAIVTLTPSLLWYTHATRIPTVQMVAGPGGGGHLLGEGTGGLEPRYLNTSRISCGTESSGFCQPTSKYFSQTLAQGRL